MKMVAAGLATTPAITMLFDLVRDPYELHNLYGQPGQAALAESLKAELARLKREVNDHDQLADQQFPSGVDGPVERLRGK